MTRLISALASTACLLCAVPTLAQAGAPARDVASIKHFFAGGTYAPALVKKHPPVVVHRPPPPATVLPLVARRSLLRLVHHRLPKDVAVLRLGDGVRGLPDYVDRAWVGTGLEQDFEHRG